MKFETRFNLMSTIVYSFIGIIFLFIVVSLVLGGLGVISGCEMPTAPEPENKIKQSQKAEEAAAQIKFTENAEIDNIKKRLELTSNPGLQGYIILLNEMGQPVMYSSVVGKVTSGSKRLTKEYITTRWDCGEWPCDKDLPAPSDEGTFGSSGEYIFFWTTSGQYMQWNGKYLYSDQPFRLTTSPLVVFSESEKQ